MPMMRAVLMAMSLSALSMTGGAKAADHESDEAAIKAVVMDYFDGQGTADRERLLRAFAEDEATMVGVLPRREGEGVEVRAWKDMREVLENWASAKNPPGAGRPHEFLDVHVTDGRIATVHFRYADRFYDALTLAKIDDEWTIIAKAFTTQ